MLRNSQLPHRVRRSANFISLAQFVADKNDLAACGIGSDFMERLPELFSGACVERLSKLD